MPKGDKTVIQFPFACPTCGNPAKIFGGRFNVTENITVRYRTCPHCQKDFVTNVNGTETFRHWVERGSRGGRHKAEGAKLWGSKKDCLKMLLRAAYYEIYCQVKLGDDEGVTDETRELIKLCKINIE